MSALPASPSRPESCSSAPASSRSLSSVRSSSHSSSPGVDAARAGRHHQALERREPHRRVDRAPVRDRAQRGPGAEMTADDPQAGGRGAQHLRHAVRDPRVREPVKSVAANAPPISPFGRKRVGGRGLGQRGVKRGVEAGHRRHAGKRVAHRVAARPRTSAGAAARDRRARPAHARPRCRSGPPRGTARRRGRSGARPRRHHSTRLSAPPRAPRFDIPTAARRAPARASGLSPSPSSDSLTLLDPAFTTRTRTASGRRHSGARPCPIAHVG